MPDECGENGTKVNDYPIPELYLEYGVPNTAGVSIVGFLDPTGTPAPLFADEGRLYTVVGGAVLEGEDLVESKILIDRAGTGDVIVIFDYDEGTSWVTGSTEPVHNYLFTYADEGGPVGPGADPCDFRVPVCEMFNKVGEEKLAWATVITNERYQLDSTHRVLPAVSQSPAPMWFNIVCRGTALYKARHWEYHPDTGVPAISTSVEEREAMLKSIVNDSCGGNMSFTENGTAVAWRNESGSVNIPLDWNFDELEVESIWDEHGATCLGQSRLEMAAQKVATHCPALATTECPDVHESVANLAAYGKIVTLVPKDP